MRTALVACFLAVIALPLSLNIAGVDGADAAAENRELAPFPSLHATVDSIAKFGNEFGHWFDDHFGLRSAFIRWYGEGRLFALGVSPTTSVIKGKDGWFYYADDFALEDYTSADPMTQEGVANWRETLLRTRRWLDSRHIGYVFLVAPDKHAVYPEFMPDTVKRVGTVSRTDELYGGITDIPGVIDIRSALVTGKTRERIYHKTDTHWNDRGALLAYQTIIAAARAQVPRIPAPWTREDFEPITHSTEAGDLASMMGLKRVLREESLELKPLRPRAARVVDPPGAAPMDEEGRLVTEIPGSPLPRAVVFRDSFTSRLVPFLSEHFSRVVYLWQNDFDSRIIEEEHADIVIEQIVGRHLYGFIPTPGLIPGE